MVFGLFLFGLTSCTTVSYQVASRRDPFASRPISPSTFSFRSDASNPDPVIEKQLFYLISQALSSKGWVFAAEGGGEYLFSVKYDLDEQTKTGSRPVTIYNPSNNSYSVTQKAYSRTVYHRAVKILAALGSNSDSPIWTADCTSTGSTEDVLTAAKYMVPYAIDRFPDEGIWRNSQSVE